ncbi:hypothetical protein QMK19_40485 [Streptomyces sp. H10-C2]|uniref:hypothetical protein n=1 Tax=unclassified Streptomyces TaxID=2593676 RepID=UPI0024B93192|nr:MULTISPECIES: hypothetical protein [unclassified Streptomyces]MDJ0347407.1 hypothetical protein [Streptomyces sp. PH10-H1]MDJ0375686.1 hypothetical protein [Streptomyces sp. H10-C2]
MLNVTAVTPSAAGFVTVYPDGQPRPDVSNLNFAAQQTIPNLVVVPVVNGKVDFYNRAGSVNLLADLTGLLHRLTAVREGSGPHGSGPSACADPIAPWTGPVRTGH